MKTSSVPQTSTGFGFDEIMRKPDYTRFPNWYALNNRTKKAA
jgi:hypothetical protein